MIGRVLLAAIAAGVAAGVFAHGAQSVEVMPLLHQAEAYEHGHSHSHSHGHGETHEHAGHGDEDSHGHSHGEEQSHAHGHDHAHGHSHEGWMPADGFERQAVTLLSNVITGVAFALLLAAAIAFSGRHVDWKRGVLWGLAGFAVFTLAPSIGLPPAAPGVDLGPVGERQLWWVGAVAGTAAGLALLVFARLAPLKVAGVLLIAAPHVVGAPLPPEAGESALPAVLAAQYVVASLVTALAFWAVLGALTGYFFDRWVRPAESPG